MRYCGPRGIPHSTFKAWDPHSQDAALSWLTWSESACPSCGTRPEEWDPKRGGDRHAYHADFTHCRGCEVRAGAEDRLSKAKAGEFRRGTTVALLKSERRA